MNDEDLRDLFAFGALIGLVMRGESILDTGYLSYKYADEAIETKYKVQDEGIASVKPKTRKKSVPE
jgi:hypothetical protein